jgi:cyclopropane-fatty-acyl-phospholipid synthase
MSSVAPASSAGLVSSLFRNYGGGLVLKLWDGTTLRLGVKTPTMVITLRDARTLRELLWFHDPLRLADAFVRGSLDMEGSIYDALSLRDHFSRLSLSLREKLSLGWAALTTGASHLLELPSAARARKAAGVHGTGHENSRETIAFHYDVSNAFYRLWLDRQMIYSCAYFETPADSLEQAQCNKLDLICRKLDLQPGETLLDIGCGWGGLVIWAAQHYGVKAHGITLSSNQFELARERIAELALDNRVTVELRDYRDLPRDTGFDKISSVGMFEHVGLKNLPGYFAAALALLKPGGLFLNHGITSHEGGWQKSLATEFINTYVFPDGELDTIANIQLLMEQAGFEILDVEAMRPHYALTLRHWVQRLEANRETAVREAGESAYRVWLLYMAGCALQFEQGDTGIYQILLGKSAADSPFPLTRRRMLLPRAVTPS